MMTRLLMITTGFMTLWPTISQGQVRIAPYYSIRSNKSVSPDQKNKTVDGEKIKQREEVGLKASIKFFSLFYTALSVGQSTLTTTEKASVTDDEYDEIDYEQDLDMSTDDPEKDITITETQQRAKFTLGIQPELGPIFVGIDIGVTALQRDVEKKEAGLPTTSTTKGPTFKPHSGINFGIKFSSRMFWMAEYEFYHYAFPDIEPFERSLTVSFGLSI